MKKTLLSLGLALGLAATSSASLIVYEGFDYNTSTINAGEGGTGFIGGWGAGLAGEPLAVVGGLSYQDLPVVGGAAADNASATRSNHRVINGAENYTMAGEKQWFSYLLNVPAAATGGQFYVTFFGSTSYQGFGSRTNFLNGNLVLHGNLDGLISNTTYQLQHDQTYLILGSATWTTDTNIALSLWVNPDLNTVTDESHLGVAQITQSGSITVGDWLWVRGNAPAQGIVDEIRLGTDFASVIPEPSTYAILFGVVALGVVIVRRRSKAASQG